MKPTGIVFDIQRCSFHDGPGIRTTVFLKGCPLRCKWCHNPESQVLQPEIMFYEEKCTGCTACVHACQSDCHSIGDGKHIFIRDDCKNCGACVKACPYSVLEYKGQQMNVESVLDEVEKDREYYNNSGGGITLSGGEPMLQFDFTLSLLAEAKNRGIHTCIETCGFAPQERYKAVIPLVDIFLFDYKATEPDEHKNLTGVTNGLILDNLDYICKSGKPVVLRCPLVPDVNDCDRHLEGIAGLCKKYPALQSIELMPYHNLGIIKSKRTGKEAFYTNLPNTSDEKKEEWLQKLNQMGCDKASV